MRKPLGRQGGFSVAGRSDDQRHPFGEILFETLNQPGAMNPSKVNSRAVELVAQDDLIQSIGFHLAYLMSTLESV